MTLLSVSSHSSVDRVPTRCSGDHGFNSYQGLRFFLCPTLMSCWIIHLTHFITILKIHHLYSFIRVIVIPSLQVSLRQCRLKVLGQSMPYEENSLQFPPSPPNNVELGALDTPAKQNKCQCLLRSLKHCLGEGGARWVKGHNNDGESKKHQFERIRATVPRTSALHCRYAESVAQTNEKSCTIARPNAT